MDAEELRRTEDATLVVVVEDGRRMQGEVLLELDEASGVAVIVHERSAPLRSLAARTIRRVNALERAGQRVGRAVVVVGERSDAAALAARCLLVRMLLAHLVQTGSGEVVLAAEGTTDPEVRHQLLALAGTLAGEIGTDGVAVRVRFVSNGRPLAHARGAEWGQRQAVA